MTLKQLATHVAEIPSWLNKVLTTTEIDFAANGFKSADVSNTNDLVSYFERSVVEGKQALANAKEDDLKETWTMRSGEKIYATDPKDEVIRGCFSQVVHHRAQLGVYLRLLNVPIPGSYGPSADDTDF
jgi:uncharacterized damage-inducible protein DinB